MLHRGWERSARHLKSTPSILSVRVRFIEMLKGEVIGKTFPLSGDGGWAGTNTQWGWAQENSSQLQFLHQPHEAVREETQTLHQQVQVCAFVSFSSLSLRPHFVWVCENEGLRLCHLMQSRCFMCGLHSGVCSLCKSQGMRLLSEECYSSSTFLHWQSPSLSVCPLFLPL